MAGLLLLLGFAAGATAAFLAPDDRQVDGLIAAGVCATGAAFLLHSGDLPGRLLNGTAGLLLALVLGVAIGPATQLVHPGAYRVITGDKVDAYLDGVCSGVTRSPTAKPRKYTCDATWKQSSSGRSTSGRLDVMSTDLDADAEFGLWAYAVGTNASALSRIPEHYPVWLPWVLKFPAILAVPFLGLAIFLRRRAVRRADPVN